jgi:hypothetical protein
MQQVKEPGGMNSFLEGNVQYSANAVEEIEDGGGAGWQYGLHDEFAVVIEHSGRDGVAVNVKTDVFEAIHGSIPFSARRFLRTEKQTCFS